MIKKSFVMITRIKYLVGNAIILFILLFSGTAQCQNSPELMHFKFNVNNSGTTPNEANPATRAGVLNPLLASFTIGGTGQFGTGLVGSGGGGSINPQWLRNHTGSWTISFWINASNFSPNYFFSNTTGNGGFRCFFTNSTL
ncbi:MAG: hypothetical protein H0X62_16905, partial [Bacteroidetes bacterium]|nr:hypothetical protein [Bacteroidota bacterium]